MKTYEVQGNIADADSVIGHSFGTSVNGDSVNALLANQMLFHDEGRPMIADRTLVNPIPEVDSRMSYIVEGDVTNFKAKGVGSWGTLIEAHQFMKAEVYAHL